MSTAPVTTNVGTSNPWTDILMNSLKWNTTNLTYSFSTSASNYVTGYYGGYANSFSALTTASQQMVRDTFTELSQLTGLTFTEVAAGDGVLKFAMTDAHDHGAVAFLPSSGETGGDVWLNAEWTSYWNDARDGHWGRHTIRHEIGHALGLKHSHEGGIMPASSSDQFDAKPWTVMAYRDFSFESLTSTTYIANDSYSQSYMGRDISALQHMYGANYTHNSDNTTYTFSNAGKIFETIWDGNGRDTIDLTNFNAGGTYNLNPGEWLDFSTSQRANLGGGNYAPGNVYLSKLHNNDARSMIENISTGSGNDAIIGNVANNIVNAGGGNNTFTGNAGWDTIEISSFASATKSGDQITINYSSGSTIISDVEFVKDGTEIYWIMNETDGLNEDRVEQLCLVYEAALDRSIDFDGMMYWSQHSASILAIADSILYSTEFTTKYGSVSAMANHDFVDLMYNNILNREGDEDGVAYWTGQLNNNVLNKNNVLVLFADSIENRGNVLNEVYLVGVTNSEWNQFYA